MEIDKTLQFDAPPPALWALLLDPVAMGACVPGMQSIEVVSDDEYIAQMQVKISFISANFKLRTRIVERDAPRYLRAEGTGEDTKVASSLKQSSEMWLTPRADGGTELRMKVKADVFGRMGAFGLNVMKTKADRLWDEFGTNAAARLAAGVPAVAAPLAAAGTPELALAQASTPAAVSATPSATPSAAPSAGALQPPPAHNAPMAPAAALAPAAAAALAPASPQPGFWARLFGATAASTDIRIELRRGDTVIKLQWPVQAAAQCTAWLQSLELQTRPSDPA